MPIKLLRSCTFETFDLKRNPAMKPALEQVRKVVNGGHWCALLLGIPGNGKTHLSIAAMHEYGLMRSMFWNVPEMLDWLRNNAYGDGARMSIDQLTKAYKTQDFLLVLDELGAQNKTGWSDEQLYRVLNARYELELPTIITTNKSPKEIDERILSRFSSGLVQCEGRDLRWDQ